ncbi:MAG: hypothetical protein KHX42_03030 [Prevotella sp.]|nr:hypothetical protein [Prevotella sp.]
MDTCFFALLQRQDCDGRRRIEARIVRHAGFITVPYYTLLYDVLFPRLLHVLPSDVACGCCWGRLCPIKTHG